MRSFRLPQQEETSVNNVKKTGDLFRKYKLNQIGAQFVPDNNLLERIQRVAKNIPNTYNKDVALIFFLNEFEEIVKDGETKRLVFDIVNKNEFQKLYRMYQSDPIINTGDISDLRNILDNQKNDKEETSDSYENNPWDTRVEKVINKYFIPENLPQQDKNVYTLPTPSFVEPVVKKPKPSIWQPEFLDKVETVVKSGLSYFDTFLSGLAPILGDKRSYHLYRYKYEIIIREGVDSLETFVKKNGHLGRDFFLEVMPLLMSEEMTRLGKNAATALVKDGDINIFPVEKIPTFIEDEAYLMKLVNNDFIRASSSEPGVDHDYMFGILDEATFWQIGEPAVMGAIRNAKDEINEIPGCETFTLKELMMSPIVSTKFQMLVSFVFQSGTGGYAYAGRSTTTQMGKVNGTTFNVSVGLKQRTQLAYNRIALKDWFSDVVRRQNPRVPILEKFIKEAQDYIRFQLGEIDLTLAQKQAIVTGIDAILSQNINNNSAGGGQNYLTSFRNDNERKYFIERICFKIPLSRLSILVSKRTLDIYIGKIDLSADTDENKRYRNVLDVGLKMRIAMNQMVHIPKTVLVRYEWFRHLSHFCL